MFTDLTSTTQKSQAIQTPHITAPETNVSALKLLGPLSKSLTFMMGFAWLTFVLPAYATELPKTSSGLAQFAQSANKNSKPKPTVAPEAPRELPKSSPLNQSATGVDAISSILGTQPLRTPPITPYEPPVKLTQSTPVPERVPAPLITDPSRINLERAVQKAFASETKPELGGYKPVPEPMRTQPQAPREQAATPKPEATQPSTQAKAPTSKQPTQTYRVVAGDSLSSLSARSGVSVADLAALNNLSVTSGLLRGQSLRFPEGALPAPPSAPKPQASNQISSQSTAATPKAQNLSDYRVAPGDGLIALSKRFDISTADLAKLNNLSPTADLYVGQTLKIPAQAPVIPETYVVKRGDTLSGVAAQFGLSVSELASLNNLSTNANLKIAQTLKLSGDPDTNTPESSTSQAIKNPSSYTVKSGDSLIQLARRFDLSTEALAEANGLSSRDQLKIGQSLVVPSLTTTYRVRRGDSLIALSKRYGMTAEELATLNNLSPSAMLQIGQTLQVPSP